MEVFFFPLYVLPPFCLFSFNLYNDYTGGGGGLVSLTKRRDFSVYSNDSITLILIETLKDNGIQDFTFVFFLKYDS